MKIDGFELLEKMKNKEIKEGTKIYCSRFNGSVHIVYEYGNLNLYTRNGERYDEDKRSGVISAEDLLNFTFEIEKDKNIKKLKIEHMENNPSNKYIVNEFGTKCFLTKHSKILADKINEIIDEVNKLKK